MVPSRVLRGVSMVDVIVGSALVLIIFMGLVGLMRASLLVAGAAKAKQGATAVANSQMEYIRAQTYDVVGTVGGIPSGVIPQNATTTLNGISYGVRTFIEYVDDAADGSGGSDSNGITTDYKRIKVSVTYILRGSSRKVELVSNYVPVAIETTTGGGTLKALIVDATGQPVAGATVRVVNSATSPTVDVTTFSDATGVVLFGGAATSTQYQIYVSKLGYSLAQTYVRDTTNQNPTPGYLTVVKDTTTTSTFAIDRLATLVLSTFYPIAATSTTDSFANASGLASQTNTQVSGSALRLLLTGSDYASSGTARSVAIAPSRLVQWTTASTTISSPAGTSARVQVADGSGTVLPDSAVPGNSAGFQGTSIDLTGVSTTTYPSLTLIANLTTNSTSTTPTITSWSMNSLVGPTPAANISFTLTGAKTVGTTGGGAPIYKTTVSDTSGSSGSVSESLEWDSYTFGITSHDVVDACSAPPFSLSPNSSNSSSIYLGARTSNALLVSVKDSAGATVSGVTVTLAKSGFSQNVTTTSCGNAYFGSLSSGTYSVTITKTGYTTTTATNVSVSGQSFYQASFP